MSIPMLAQDKANHALAGSLAASAAAAAAPLAGIPPALAALAGSSALGVLIEVGQALINWRAGAEVHDVDGLDAIATALGGLPVAAVAL